MVILENHDPTKPPIGFITELIEGRMYFSFNNGVNITQEMLFDIFGNAGIQILGTKEENGIDYICNGFILEWSI